VTPENEEPKKGIDVSAADIAAILRGRGWLGGEASPPLGPDLSPWLGEAAALLGPQSEDRNGLEDLLGLIFHYNAQELLGRPAHQAILTREGARDIIRGLATMVLADAALDSDRYKEIVTELRTRTGYQGQKLFYPVRLALAGRAGGGPLDRVILLLDRAAALHFPAVVKSNRQRILEFCAAMD
jgi:hypothetical protein